MRDWRIYLLIYLNCFQGAPGITGSDGRSGKDGVAVRTAA